MKTIIRFALAALLTAAPASRGLAQVRPRDLTTASMEDLMNIEITSASRKGERADGVPAAVYVLTQSDIRRSGMTSVPELLRLVPGVQVAQINANKWAVSIRGFNGLYSNKLLVLIDGRTVYNRLFAGVLWHALDLLIEDIDRIEVIRGPGAAVWGANAVNGVINIVTRAAGDTPGTMVRVGVGTFETAQAAVRYGGAIGHARYRVYSQWSAIGDSQLAANTSADDDSHRLTNGFRTDWMKDATAFTLEGNVTTGQAKAMWLDLTPRTVQTGGVPFVDRPSSMTNGSVLARWTRSQRSGASLQLQSSLDFDQRAEPVGDYHRRAADIDVGYHVRLPRGHDLVAGGGLRLTDEQFIGGTGYTLTPSQADNRLFNVFAQDEIALARGRVNLTLGARVEHDTLGGLGVQPTARAMWNVVPQRQHAWVAVSRALRTPSTLERGIRIERPPVIGAGGVPVVVVVSGDSRVRAEELVDTEAGYRLDVGSVATVSATAFVGEYDHLRTIERLTPSLALAPGGPHVVAPVRFGNLLDASTRGFEIAARWDPVPAWRLDAGYTAFHLTPRLSPASTDPAAALSDGDAPGHQWHAHTGLALGARLEADGQLFHVAALEAMRVPAYTRADVRMEWKITRQLSAIGVGQNLFDRAHAESAGTESLISTQVPRSARLHLRWWF